MAEHLFWFNDTLHATHRINLVISSTSLFLRWKTKHYNFSGASWEISKIVDAFEGKAWNLCGFLKDILGPIFGRQTLKNCKRKFGYLVRIAMGILETTLGCLFNNSDDKIYF